MREKYNGSDQIHVANGSGMEIKHIGQSVIYTPTRDLTLKHVLHVPEASKNLISVHRLATDNNAHLEFHPDFFLVKDQTSKKVLLRGKCKRGLYPLPLSSLESGKTVCAAIRPSSNVWHSRLGHPSFSIVHQIVSKNNIPCDSEPNKYSICDACQQGKSHQLPYPISTSVSTVPLQLCVL